VVLDLLVFESGRDAYARRAVWRHDGRVSDRASERNARRQSTEGAFMVVAAVWCGVVGGFMYTVFALPTCTLICLVDALLPNRDSTGVSEGSARGCHTCEEAGPAFGSRGTQIQPRLVTAFDAFNSPMRPTRAAQKWSVQAKRVRPDGDGSITAT
jgi:hypothetical protein